MDIQALSLSKRKPLHIPPTFESMSPDPQVYNSGRVQWEIIDHPPENFDAELNEAAVVPNPITDVFVTGRSRSGISATKEVCKVGRLRCRLPFRQRDHGLWVSGFRMNSGKYSSLCPTKTKATAPQQRLRMLAPSSRPASSTTLD